MRPVTQEQIIGFANMYVKAVGEYQGSNACGLLRIGLDEREEYKDNFVRPSLPGFEEYRKAFDKDGLVLNEEVEDNIVIPFEEKAEEMMERIERAFIDALKDLVRQRFNINS